MNLFIIVYILVFVIFVLIAYSVMQIKLAGMNVKDFWDFIQANQVLESLYRASKEYEQMSQKEQIIFLMEAEKIFSAFDKVPNMLWEDEYQKYSKILEIYKNIKMLRWNKENSQ